MPNDPFTTQVYVKDTTVISMSLGFGSLADNAHWLHETALRLLETSNLEYKNPTSSTRLTLSCPLAH